MHSDLIIYKCEQITFNQKFTRMIDDGCIVRRITGVPPTVSGWNILENKHREKFIAFRRDLD